ncbi:hypothetical protein [Chitinophaga deserti]|uniref:hypothetical protein n=1 Tax=Chitinophaga deserti TaxID=2164099 RepID=UPI000D6AFEDC|nr:hypothetical protein [Chitinophaga deserti]
MAILDSLIPFTGRLGNIIAYKRNGKHCLRTVPDTVRQTANTRRAAKTFGAASRKGALVRNAIRPHLDIFPDRALVNRLNSYILEAGRNNHAGLKGFRFNGYTGLSKYFGPPPVFTKDGRLHIPPQCFQRFKKAVRMEIKVIASRIDFSTRSITGTDTAVLSIDLNERFQDFEGGDLWVNVPGKGTLVVALQVKQFFDDFDIRDRKCEAADIIAVVEDQPKKVVTTQVNPHKHLSYPPRTIVHKPVPVQNGLPVIQRE